MSLWHFVDTQAMSSGTALQYNAIFIKRSWGYFVSSNVCGKGFD